MKNNKEKTEKKNTRRGNGEGSIFQRNDKRWVAQIQIGINELGNPIYKTFYGKERKDVVKKLKDYKLLLHQGYNNLSNVILKDYITTWLNVVKKISLKPLSFDRLESTINNHVIPKIGHYELNKLTSDIIQEELINKMIEENMSYSSIKKAYNAINACLQYATDNRKLIFNPVKTVNLPSTSNFETKEIEILSEDEIKKIEEVCEMKYSNGKPVFKIGYGFILILYTGVRMAEALALKWSHIDLVNKTIKIAGSVVMTKNRNKDNENNSNYILKEQDSTKTLKSKRTIRLTNKAINSLIKLNEIYQYKNEDYIFQTSNKTPIRPRNLQNTFDDILEKANIPHKGIHSLRHTFASLLFKKGIDVKTVSELLGHADVRITYQTYIHLLEEQKNKAIDLLDED